MSTHERVRSPFATLLLLSFISVVPAASFAGEILQLQAGSIQIQDQSNQLLTPILSARTKRNASQYFVIQFANPILESDKTELSSRGIEVLRYIPEDALVVKGDAALVAAARLTLGAKVRAVSVYHSNWRVSPELLTTSFLFSTESKAKTLLISAFDESAAPGVLSQIKGTPGVQVIRALSGDRDLIVKALPGNIQRLSEAEGVEWIQELPVFWVQDFVIDAPRKILAADEPCADFKPTGPSTPEGYTFTGYESGTKIMNFDAAWNRGYNGEGQKVAIGDTGLDSGNASNLHVDFENSFFKGYTSGPMSDDWLDRVGHGTHVAGSIAGGGQSSQGQIKGGAHGAKIIMQGIATTDLGLSIDPNLKTWVDGAYADGARIHSNSWGGASGGAGTYDTFANRFDEYMWNHPDMLFIFAAGNSGIDKDKDGVVDVNSMMSPGTAKNVLTVGASENVIAAGGIQKKWKMWRGGNSPWMVDPVGSDKPSDNQDGMAAFSSRGPTKDGRLKPEIVSPGTNIISARSQYIVQEKDALDVCQPGLGWGEFGSGYLYMGGTSMATPLTAGAAAVAREFLVKGRMIANPSAALVKATLIHTATDMYPGQFGAGAKQDIPVVRPNVHEGYGRTNMDAVTALGTETIVVDEVAGVGTGETKTVASLGVTAGAGIRVTLSYTDAPGAVSAAKTLVNDVDLQVIDAKGVVYQKNDHINNTEMLEIKNLSAGQYTVVVKGINVPKGKSGKQPFAVVATSL